MRVTSLPAPHRSDDALRARATELARAIAAGAEVPAAVAELRRSHGELRRIDPEAAAAARRAALGALRQAPDLAADPEVGGFLVETVEPQDFGGLEWSSPREVIAFCDTLHLCPAPTPEARERVRAAVEALLSRALAKLQERGDLEQMVRLLQLAPVPAALSGPELLHLRNRAYLYEMRRVTRNRRILAGYLVAQALMIVLVFPFLFIHAENGTLQREIEEATQLQLEVPTQREFTYSDGLYWAVITAASVGYGDLTPRSPTGKAIAAVLGVMGVVTIGVIAGRVLEWVTPRRLD